MDFHSKKLINDPNSNDSSSLSLSTPLWFFVGVFFLCEFSYTFFVLHFCFFVNFRWISRLYGSFSRSAEVYGSVRFWCMHLHLNFQSAPSFYYFGLKKWLVDCAQSLVVDDALLNCAWCITLPVLTQSHMFPCVCVHILCRHFVSVVRCIIYEVICFFAYLGIRIGF